MDTHIYYNLLNVSPDANEEELKRAYHRVALDNHPDHFPSECREVQELKMMQINEVYNMLLDWCRGRGEKVESSPPDDEETVKERGFDAAWRKHSRERYAHLSASRDVGEPRDPSYAYYRQGFIHFSRGLHGIMAQSPARYRADAASIITWARDSIHEFHQANLYFSRVVAEYPESIWSQDATEKLKRIEKFNLLYIRILHNMKERLRESAKGQV